MATIQGTIQSIHLVDSNPKGGVRKTYLVTLGFAAATDGDVCSVSNLHTNIQNQSRNGKSFTIRKAQGCRAGVDTSGNAIYATAVVTAGTTAGQIDFKLGGVTAAATVAACDGVGLLVTGDES